MLRAHRIEGSGFACATIDRRQSVSRTANGAWRVRICLWPTAADFKGPFGMKDIARALPLWFCLLCASIISSKAQAEAESPQHWQVLIHQSYDAAAAQLTRDLSAASTPPSFASAYRRGLQLHSLYQRHRELNDLLQAMARHPQLAQDAELQIERLLAQAQLERNRGKAAAAAKLLSPLRSSSAQLSNPTLRHAVQMALAEVDASLGQRDQATLTLTRVIEESKRQGHAHIAADAWLALAEVQLEMNDYQQALAYHQEALDHAPPWALQTQAKAHMGMAQMTNMVGVRSQAFIQLDKALQQFRDSQNLKGEADALLLRGFFLRKDKQFETALPPNREALALRESLGSEADIINALTHLCSNLIEVGRIDEGVKMCQRAAERADLTDSPAMQWDAHGALANALSAKGDHRQALTHLKRSERALFTLSRMDLIGQTAAIREQFETDRQRLENQRLSERLAHEKREQRRLQIALAAMAVLLALLAAAGVTISRLYWKARNLAQVDGLTGLLNRRRWLELAQTEYEKSTRYGTPMALVAFDLDHFKKINDTHGHAAGDSVLKQMAKLCSESLRHGDLAGRTGGEEFLLLLPHTNEEAAQRMAERLRKLFEEQLKVGPNLPVTASFGVATLSSGSSLPDLLQRADEAMYQAKAGGRNQVKVSTSA